VRNGAGPSLRTVNLGAAVTQQLLGVHLTGMSVRPLVYQQPLPCFCALLISAAGWPYGLGEGSTNSVSPVPLTCVPVQGGNWFVQSRKLPERAMRLSANASSLNMLPFDVRHPSRDAKSQYHNSL
jgi:hypothetical protein